MQPTVGVASYYIKRQFTSFKLPPTTSSNRQRYFIDLAREEKTPDSPASSSFVRFDVKNNARKLQSKVVPLLNDTTQ